MTFTYTLQEIDNIAEKLLKNFKYEVILFEADMGSGKTTLIKALLKQLGVRKFSGSPTFSLVNEYEVKDQAIYHFDLYRLEAPEELYDIGFEDYLNNQALIFIEWPELATDFLDDAVHRINLETVDTETRRLTMS